jgi:hypothetical protein
MNNDSSRPMQDRRTGQKPVLIEQKKGMAAGPVQDRRTGRKPVKIEKSRGWQQARSRQNSRVEARVGRGEKNPNC